MHPCLTLAFRTAILAIAGLLAACGALPGKPPQVTLYDFGPGVIHAGSAEAAVPRLPTLILADIDTNPSLDSTQVLYRLGYADPKELRAYTQSRWSLPPAQLLRQRLRDALLVRRIVLDPQESAGLSSAAQSPLLTLRLTLDEFSHYFESANTSVGLVRAHATLTQRYSGGDRILAQRVFAVPRPAPSADAPGGVKALTEASDALIAQLLPWIDQAR